MLVWRMSVLCIIVCLLFIRTIFIRVELGLMSLQQPTQRTIFRPAVAWGCVTSSTECASADLATRDQLATFGIATETVPLVRLSDYNYKLLQCDDFCNML